MASGPNRPASEREVTAADRSQQIWYGAALALLVLLGAVVRALYLDQPMRLDESTTWLSFASGSFGDSLSNYSDPNNHLFHSLLVNVSARIFGNHPWSLRLPAYAAGVAMIPATYAAVAAYYHRGAGLLAAGAVAASSWFILFSTNARGYSIVYLVFLLLLVVARRLVDVDRTSLWLAFIGLAVIGFWTIPSMTYPFAGVVLLMLVMTWRRQDSGDRKRFVTKLALSCGVTGALTILVYLPAIVHSGRAAITNNVYVRPLSLSQLADGFGAWARTTFSMWNLDYPVMTWVIVLGAALLGLAWARRATRERIPVGPVIVVAALGLMVVQRVLPPPRLMLFLFLVYIGTAAAGIAAAADAVVRERSRRAVFAVTSVVLATALSLAVIGNGTVVRSKHTGAFPEADRAAAYLARYLRTGDVVLAAVPSHDPLRYYLEQRGISPGVVATYDRLTVPISGRLVIVVNLGSGPRLERFVRFLESRGVDADGAAAPRPIARIEQAALYELGGTST